MYRIELSPGEETAFRSIEELAVAIRRGVVTARARIWHNASGKWLPVQFHPHYKIAASMELTKADLVAGPPVKKLELLTLGEQMDPAPAVARPAVEAEKPAQPERSERVEQPARATRRPEPEPEPKPRKKAAKSRRTRSGRKSMRLALAGALFIGCAHLAYSAAAAALSGDVASRGRSQRHLITTPTNAIDQGRPETTAAAVLPSLPKVPRPTLHASSSIRPQLPAPLPTESAARGEAASLESGSEAATPPLGAFRADSAPDIQPAPTSDIAAPVPLGDSLARKMVDSTGKKTLKRILRTIGGTPTAEQTRPKH